MRLRSPAEYWIRHLIVHPRGYTTDEIKDRLLDEGLDFISVDYIERLRRKLEPPSPFRPEDPRHPPSFAFITKERINRAFQPDSAMKIAKEILETPRVKEFVETMILAHAPFLKMADFITRERDMYCTQTALELYKHYFWNIDLLDATQMRVLLAMRVEVASELPEFSGRKKLLQSAYYKDPRKAAADLPYSPTSAMIAQMRLGIRPRKEEIALRMMETRDLAIIRAIEAAQQDGPHDSQKFLNYTNGGRILEELLQTVVKPEEHMREQLAAIVLKTDDGAMPSIHQLSQGDHTTDLGPEQEANEDDGDSEDGGGSEEGSPG